MDWQVDGVALQGGLGIARREGENVGFPTDRREGGESGRRVRGKGGGVASYILGGKKKRNGDRPRSRPQQRREGVRKRLMSEGRRETSRAQIFTLICQ